MNNDKGVPVAANNGHGQKPGVGSNLDSNLSAKFDIATFISVTTGAEDGSHLSIAVGTGARRIRLTFAQFKEAMASAPALLDDNLWFCPSVLDGQGRTAANCLSTQSILLEADYGSLGHKRPSPFPDYQSALDHIYIQPVQPQILWHSGHGFQMAFLLEEPVIFADSAAADVYENQKWKLCRLFRCTETPSRAGLFRFPGCMNKKPGCPDVRGSLLRWEVEP